MRGYCQRCGSKLAPADFDYLKVFGVCSYCVTVSKTSKAQCPTCKGDSVGRLAYAAGNPIAEYVCPEHGEFIYASGFSIPKE